MYLASGEDSKQIPCPANLYTKMRYKICKGFANLYI